MSGRDEFLVGGSLFLVESEVGSGGTVVCSGLWYAELDPGALSESMMARALGLWRSFFPHVCASCGDADTEPSKFMELDQGHMGIMLRAVCEPCLRVEFLARCGARAAGETAMANVLL